MFKQTVTAKQINENPSALLNEFQRQFLSPTAFDVIVNPGSVFTWGIFADLKMAEGWKLGVGYDYYLKQREEFERVLSSPESDIGSNIDLSDLNVRKAENPPASQHKYVAELSYDKELKNKIFQLSLGADYAFASKKIGEDWTIFGKIGVKF